MSQEKAILQRQPMLVNKEKSSGKNIDAIRFYIKNKPAGQVKTEICKVEKSSYTNKNLNFGRDKKIIVDRFFLG